MVQGSLAVFYVEQAAANRHVVRIVSLVYIMRRANRVKQIVVGIAPSAASLDIGSVGRAGGVSPLFYAGTGGSRPPLAKIKKGILLLQANTSSTTRAFSTPVSRKSSP